MPAVKHHRGVVLGVALGCLLASATPSAAASPLAATALAGSVFDRVHMGSAAASAAPQRGATYAGSTSADDPIVLHISPGGTRIDRVVMQVEATCAGSQAPVLFFVDRPALVSVRRSGRFAGVDASQGALVNGNPVATTLVLRGRVEGRRLTGSVGFRGEIKDLAGVTVDTCEQSVTFKLRSRRGKVFGGTTSQGGPVVAELEDTVAIGDDSISLVADVRHFHVGWRAACSDGDVLQMGDTVIDFRIRAGRFGDDWSNTYSRPDGSKDILEYSLHGMIERARLTGTFSVRWTHVDAAGVQTTCETGLLTYTSVSG